MMGSRPWNRLKREVCGFCTKEIRYGQPTVVLLSVQSVIESSMGNVQQLIIYNNFVTYCIAKIVSWKIILT